MATAVAEQRDLATVLTELKGIQDQYVGKVMPPTVGEQFEKLAEEAKAIQDAQDRAKLVADLEKKSREVLNPALPKSGEKVDTKAEPAPGDPDEVVGYVNVGQLFTHSPEFKSFIAAGAPRMEGMARVHVGALMDRMGQSFVPVTREAKSQMLESKATATIASLVVPRDRIADVVRASERQTLSVRDILNVSQTTSNMVEYMTQTAPTVVAAPTAESAVKPEATIGFDLATAPVRTIAVTMPVTEQQLQDIPALTNAINTELLYQLALVEEQQIVWGVGTGENLLGIFNTSGVTAGRTVGGDTIIDQIRRAMTDVALNYLNPNGAMLHPLDYEAVVLTKGTDGHYLYQVFPAADGGYRVWGLRIVESIAMQKPTRVLTTTYERRFLVGDFIRGATLWDRQQATLAVGWINDQFVRNQRTIRAEERLAFGVKRPGAFKYRITQAET